MKRGRLISILWTLVVVAPAVASIALQGLTLTGGGLGVLGLAGLVVSSTLFAVERDSVPRYDLSEWSKAVREQNGENAVIVLNVEGSVTIDANGRKIDFATPTGAIQLTK